MSTTPRVEVKIDRKVVGNAEVVHFADTGRRYRVEGFVPAEGMKTKFPFPANIVMDYGARVIEWNDRYGPRIVLFESVVSALTDQQISQQEGPTYSHERWTNLLKQTVGEIEKLSKLKGGEYAGDDDRLANFRRNADSAETTMEFVWRIYASKHWDAIMQYEKDLRFGKARDRAEPITGRIDDMIVYLILLKAMVEERSLTTTANEVKT